MLAETQHAPMEVPLWTKQIPLEKFVRSKCSAVLFFIALFFANWFAYQELCSALQNAGCQVPGRWLLLFMLGVLALYEVVEHRFHFRAKSGFCM